MSPAAGTGPDSLEVLDKEVDRFLELVASADPSVPVPACPGLTVGQLARHLGGVYSRVGDWIEDRRPAHGRSLPPTGDVPAWVRAQYRRLRSELVGRDPDAACASWSPWDSTVAFWLRRMTLETVVHRVDAEQAVGSATAADDHVAIHDDVAIDGIAEVLTLWLGTRLGPNVGGDGRLIEVRCSGHRWGFALHEHLVDYVYRDEPGADPASAENVEACISGPAAAVYLWLWGRAPIEAVEIDGDARLAVELRGALARATQ